MSEATSAPAEGGSAPVDYAPPADTQEPLSLDQAFAMMSEPPKQEEEQPAESAEPATAEEPAQAASEPETAHAEEPEASEPETPAIDPPRSWTKEAKERWSSLPRETQEYLAQRESERDRGLLRSQNELADQRKAFEAEREAVKALKQQYETQLPNLVKTLESALQSQFSDIKDMNDVRNLQAQDPFRFQQWQLHQMELAAAKQEEQAATSQKAQEEQSRWGKYVQDESAKFAESLAESDKARLNDLNKAAPEFLKERGFTQEQLNDLASGKEKLSIYDHRLQALILDGMKYRDLQKAPLKAVPKSVPPVQRPGVSAPNKAGVARTQNIQALTQKLNSSGSLEDAMELLRAQRSA